MTRRRLPILPLCCLPVALAAGQGTLLDDSVIDPLAHNFPATSFSSPTVHGVTFQQDGLTTHKGWQYAAYYQGNLANSYGKVAVARRPLPGGSWQSLVLDDYTFTSTDSHNDVVLGICGGDGTIHLSFDHHVHPLKYRVSVAGLADDPAGTAWTPARFGPVSDRLVAGGAALGSVTYPRFLPTPGGKLLFTHRYGGSGGGDEILHEYDGASHAWSLVGQYTTRTGAYTGSFASGTDRNAYFDNTLFDAGGRLHATWCWRETPDAASNHDLLYAWSDDTGRTWKNQTGATIATAGSAPISVDSPGLVAWPIPQQRNYINNSAMTIDRAGRVHVVAWHLPDGFPDQAFDSSPGSNSRYIHYWRGTDGLWHKRETDLTGRRAKLAADDDGRLFLVYGDATNVRIAAASPAPEPEATPSGSWTDWAPLALSGALPAGRANLVNVITDSARWETDRILSVYAQETNTSGTAPTPLHVLDYHVSRAAVLPTPRDRSHAAGPVTALAWTAGQGAVQHDVYLGLRQAAVAAATPASPEYLGRQAATTRAIGDLSPAATCYWRVDSVDAAGTVTAGRVWSFANGDLTPSVTQGAATRAYGGRAVFEATLDSKDPALAGGDLVLHLGEADGGTEPGAWQRSLALGQQAAGRRSLPVDGIPPGSLRYRFQLTTPHGTAWAATAGTLPADGDLASWAHCAAVDLTGYQATAALEDFPVLLRVSPASFPGFAHADLLSPPHGDLRFSDESGTVLDHEVESWNPADTCFVWVKVPRLAPGTRLFAWWGKAGQNPPPPSATWSAFRGVWHLDQGLGFAKDSSPNNLAAAATAVDPAATGVIPGAANLDGTASTVAIDNAPALNPAQLSVEAWVKTSSANLQAVCNKDKSSGGRVWQFRLNAGKPEFIVFNATANASAAATGTVNDNAFHHLCGTWDGATIRVYIDGNEQAATPFAGTLRAGQANRAFIGRGENAAAAYFAGTIDEVRLSPGARPAEWVRASWDNQRPGADFATARHATTPDLDGDLLPDAWEMRHFGSTRTTAGDPDADGRDNLLEYALGGDPRSGADPPPLALGPGGGGSWPELVYPQRAGGSGETGTTYAAGGLRYTAEFSADLSDWRSGPGVVAWSGRRDPLPDGMERVGVNLVDPALAAGTRLFGRLRVSAAE